MIKLIASDMDGTLLRDDKSYSEEFQDVYEEMKKRNMMFMVASGNQYDLLLSKFDESIRDDLIYLCENGTKVVYQGRTLYTNFLDKNDYLETLEIIKPYHDCMIVVSGNKHAYISKDYEYKKDFISLFMKNVVFVDSYDDIDDDILKFSLAHFDGQIEKRTQAIASKLNNRLKLVTTGHVWFDIFYKTVNKGTTLTALLQEFHINKDEVAAFGDQMNDYEMLQSVKYAYATENAVPAIKAIAYAIVDTNENDGVVKKIKEILKGVY